MKCVFFLVLSRDGNRVAFNQRILLNITRYRQALSPIAVCTSEKYNFIECCSRFGPETQQHIILSKIQFSTDLIFQPQPARKYYFFSCVFRRRQRSTQHRDWNIRRKPRLTFVESLSRNCFYQFYQAHEFVGNQCCMLNVLMLRIAATESSDVHWTFRCFHSYFQLCTRALMLRMFLQHEREKREKARFAALARWSTERAILLHRGMHFRWHGERRLKEDIQ